MKRVCTLILVVLLIMCCLGCSDNKENKLVNSISLDTFWTALAKEIEDLPNPTINQAEGSFSATMDNFSITGKIDKENNITNIRFENSGFRPEKWFNYSSYTVWVNEVCYMDIGSMKLEEVSEFLCIDNPINELEAFYSILGQTDDPFECAVKTLLGETIPKITNWNISTRRTNNGIVVTLQFTG